MLSYLFLQIFNVWFVVVQVEWINAETPKSKLLNFVMYYLNSVVFRCYIL